MTEEHRIAPPPELVQQWLGNYFGCVVNGELSDSEKYLATQAARWGADQELDACCEWVSQWRCMVGGNRPELGLRAARRPKPPSLKEKALEAVQNIDDACESMGFSRSDDTDIIRRALESLPS